MGEALDVRWFNPDRLNLLVGILLFLLFLLVNLARARRAGGELYIRPLPALQALDEAIGRATEMGRPVLYMPGLARIPGSAAPARWTP